jgi:hypothetical protein
MIEIGLKSEFAIISILIVIGYWMLAANFIFDKFVDVIFLNAGVFASFVTSAGIGYAQTIPVIEYTASLLGQFLIYGFAVMGFLFCLSMKEKNLRLLALTVISLILLAIGGFGQILAIGVAPDRLVYYCFVLIPIPAAYGIYHTLKRISKNRKFSTITVASLFLIASFLMITAPQADIDSPIYSQDLVSPRFIKESEFVSINNILENYDGAIGTDNDLASLLNSLGNSNSAILDFHSAEFVTFDGLVIIRKFYDTEPIYSRGLYRMNLTIYNQLLEPSFDNIYDSGSLRGYFNIDIQS